MADASQSQAEALSEPRPPAYRAIIIAKSGTVVNALRLQAEDDEKACERAKALVNGHAVELWDGLRFIEHFPPIE
jgi:hypothetical protein